MTNTLETKNTRTLPCGCMDRWHSGQWEVFLLCALHYRGRKPVQDDHAGR